MGEVWRSCGFRRTDLGPIAFKGHVELAGGTIAGPGGTSEPTMLHLTKGIYEVVCFVPATTDQRPHFEHGMHQTLTVG